MIKVNRKDVIMEFEIQLRVAPAHLAYTFRHLTGVCVGVMTWTQTLEKIASVIPSFAEVEKSILSNYWSVLAMNRMELLVSYM